jgi:non-heme chloroperoxidase
MDTITVKDGTQIYYKDWGTGQPLFFHHGWPLSADDWDAQMMFFLDHGYRVIAHDRRGHGRSTQTVTGNDMDTYAADVAELVKALDLKNAIHIGHSTGGGEVTRYVAQHGKGRVAKAVLISAIPPTFMKSDRNPDGVPRKPSTACVTARRTIVPSSTKTSRFPFTASIVPARLSPKAFERTGGGKA